MVTKKEAVCGILKAFVVLASQIYATYLLVVGNFFEGVTLAVLTLGDTASPAQLSIYFDSVFSQSLPSYKNRITDNIGNLNAVLKKILDSDMYESDEGGTYWFEDLLYAFASMEAYDGYDELSTATTDGVTQAQYTWAQLAVPTSYSMKELIQNRRRVTNLVKTKILQMDLGFQEGFATDFMQGSGDGALHTPKTNPINGATSINPLPLLVKYDPTTGNDVGNIPISKTWWRNRTKTAVITSSSKPSDFIAEWMNFYNTVSLKNGGPPDVCLADQITFELCAMALYDKYRNTQSDNSFPFTNLKIPFGNGKSLIIMDDKVPDVHSGVTNTDTYGTMYLLNSKFFKMKYIEGRDFEMLTDENGKAFTKPHNQDSRIGHSAWMGQAGVNNRIKHGVWGKIPRALTYA